MSAIYMQENNMHALSAWAHGQTLRSIVGMVRIYVNKSKTKYAVPSWCVPGTYYLEVPR